MVLLGIVVAVSLKGSNRTVNSYQLSVISYSNFYLGLHVIAWWESLQFFAVEIRELMKLSPQKCANYQRGLRAASLIASTL